MNSERRRAPRYQLIAEAEIDEVESGTKLKAKTGGLSLGGCFIDTLNPPPENTEVRVTIRWGSTQFSLLGRVVFVFPNLGMGVMFTSVAADQLPVLEAWLTGLSGGTGVTAITGETDPTVQTPGPTVFDALPKCDSLRSPLAINPPEKSKREP
jgi:hypothetical protein